ncbi:hypothetical protein [Variovorax ginsengisoli]|uniref:HNH endonuclease n=1 Tax=Variovorax ginsengisoli TaxID=363844 RepID=A0ABT9S5U5_9BURK|nr:hypothetical protein [Variovorax ginsengisoli]MDP9899730.1 hypothetical protein [Variovorax ginsengisoli]
MSVKALRSTFGPHCHWCGLPMDFDEPAGRPESATIEHLNDATLGSVRKQTHRRLAHGACNQMRNELRMQAERAFQAWVAQRVEAAKGDGSAVALSSKASTP